MRLELSPGERGGGSTWRRECRWQKTDEKSRVHKGGFGRTQEEKEELARWPRSDRWSGGFRGCQGVGKDRKAKTRKC